MKIKKDLTFGIFSVVLGIVLWVLIPHAISSVVVVETNGTGPTFMPKLLSILLVLLGAILIVQSLVFKKDSYVEFSWKKEKNVVCFLGILLALILGMNFIGFLPSAIVASVLFFLLLGEKSKKRYLIMALICVIVYVVFKFGLKVPLL